MKVDLNAALRAFRTLAANAHGRSQRLLHLSRGFSCIGVHPLFEPGRGWLRGGFDTALYFANAQPLRDDMLGDFRLHFGGSKRQERSGVAWRELLLLDELAYAARQPEKSQQIGDGGTILTDTLRDLFLRVAELADEAAIGPGFFYGIQLFALDVLDERDLEHLPIVYIADDHGNAPQAGSFCRSPPTLPRYDLKPGTHAPREDGLHNSMLRHGLGEFPELGFVHVLAGLIRVGVDAFGVDVEKLASASCELVR